MACVDIERATQGLKYNVCWLVSNRISSLRTFIFIEHTRKIVSKRRNSPVILCIYNGMLTTGIHRKVSIPGHSYVWNELANKVVKVYLKENTLWKNSQCMNIMRLFQNKNCSMQEDDEVRSWNACEICSWAHIHNSEIGSWNFDQKHLFIHEIIN